MNIDLIIEYHNINGSENYLRINLKYNDAIVCTCSFAFINYENYSYYELFELITQENKNNYFSKFDKLIYITHIESYYKKRGYAKYLIQYIKDKYKLPIFLVSYPFDTNKFSLDYQNLIDFYKAFEFIEIQDNFLYGENSKLMFYKPNNNK